MKQITLLRYSFRYSPNLSRNIMANNILISKGVWRGWHACVGGVLAWVACLHGSVGSVLACVA